jgi:hypothetical protein
MIIKRMIAEFLSILWALFVTLLGAGILVATTANVFWPVFIIGGIICYFFTRTWMHDVLEIKKLT